MKFEGLPPFSSDGEDGEDGSKRFKNVVFENVASIWITRQEEDIPRERMLGEKGVVVITSGRITCTGTHISCSTSSLLSSPSTYRLVNLANGSLSPGFTSVGSPLGLVEILQEASTQDGLIINPVTGESKGGEAAVVKAVDGLQFATRDALCVIYFSLSLSNVTNLRDRVAYRAGVTSAITSPRESGGDFYSLGGGGTFRGLGVFFGTGRANALERVCL